MISREKCLEWADEHPHRYSTYSIDIEALINRAYAEGQLAMRERASKVCLSLFDMDDHPCDEAEKCAATIQNLEFE